MTRTGRRGRASYRVGAFDVRTRRDGTCLEVLGSYDPGHPSEAKRLNLKGDRIRHWLSVGARPTVKVAALLKKQGLLTAGGKSSTPATAGGGGETAGAGKD
jgi:small subunit ribosomal protein S16